MRPGYCLYYLSLLLANDNLFIILLSIIIIYFVIDGHKTTTAPLGAVWIALIQVVSGDDPDDGHDLGDGHDGLGGRDDHSNGD